MTIRILISLVAGVIFGMLFLPETDLAAINLFTEGALALLIFTVGFDLGLEDNLWKKVKSLPKMVLAIPFMIALGSIFGAVIVSKLLRLPLGEGVLVGSGFGWYSLSAVIIAQTYDVSIGALALLTNVFREVFALILIPPVARKISFLAAVAPGGATTMDVTLPVIAQNTDNQTALIAFYSGTVLTFLVPIVVPFIIRLL